MGESNCLGDEALEEVAQRTYRYHPWKCLRLDWMGSEQHSEWTRCPLKTLPTQESHLVITGEEEMEETPGHPYKENNPGRSFVKQSKGKPCECDSCKFGSCPNGSEWRQWHESVIYQLPPSAHHEGPWLAAEVPGWAVCQEAGADLMSPDHTQKAASNQYRFNFFLTWIKEFVGTDGLRVFI